MIRKIIYGLLCALILIAPVRAEEIDGWDLFEWMQEALVGEWVLSPEDEQLDTYSYTHAAVMPLVGTDETAMSYKLIGRETTIQEDLLPGTAKQMVTMYHCKGLSCSTLRATHYCVKMNQPVFLANLEKSTPERFVFDCDMSTELCRSDDDHVHTILLELSNGGNHLKASYLSWENQKPKKISSIYHFDKKR